MPKKVRELKSMLKKAGFAQKDGKGSHVNFFHPRYPGRVTISGNDGADAQRYQEELVDTAIRIVRGDQ